MNQWIGSTIDRSWPALWLKSLPTFLKYNLLVALLVEGSNYISGRNVWQSSDVLNKMCKNLFNVHFRLIIGWNDLANVQNIIDFLENPERHNRTLICFRNLNSRLILSSEISSFEGWEIQHPSKLNTSQSLLWINLCNLRGARRTLLTD